MRLDSLLVILKKAGSRERAKELIRNSQVLVNQKVINKPAFDASEEDEILVTGEVLPYVSRGGLKLAHALKEFGTDVTGRICVDIGASTGGFTDVLLKNGAEHVYAIDAGTDQLHEKLKNDPRVTSLEKTNIRGFDPRIIGQAADFICVDVSFISLKLVLPEAFKLLRAEGDCIALIKPQFEAGQKMLNKHGVVRSEKAREAVKQDISLTARSLGFLVKGLVPSPITGGDGNTEYLIHLVKP